MGQFWTVCVFNLDKERVEAGGSKLGEFLPYSCCRELSHRLLPSNILVTPKTATSLSDHYDLTIPHFAPSRDIVRDLLRRIERVMSERLGMYISKYELVLLRSQNTHTPPSPGNRVGLLTLPVELLIVLFQTLTDTFSITALSLTCQLCFPLGRARLVERNKELCLFNATSVGDRLICVGDNSSIGDLPEGIFDDAEKQDLMVWPGDSQPDPQEVGMERLHAFLKVRCEESNLQRRLFDTAFWDKAMETQLIERPFVEQTRLLELLFTEMMYTFENEQIEPHGRDLVLCNTTAGEFVRGDAFSSLYEGADPELITDLQNTYERDISQGGEPFYERRLGFAEILVSHICWSHDYSISMGDPTWSVHRGRWAGHRFAITAVDAKPSLGIGKTWKDVSEEIMEEMKELWIGEFGDEWQEKL
ncbi:hypothetical protein BXZ70DRAFT_101194 [Cristinia sonorae]|uniref:F-box domain-containing protein n=1 Tax=Cristinia sonorae TaxID=1940300 RepID=A0A8K0UQA9_9AGAR|nr:hypothetical protein BXZ70DRAFT_101194 [Cristinia sonorae]